MKPRSLSRKTTAHPEPGPSSPPAYIDPQCVQIITAAVQRRCELGLSCYRVAKRAHLALSTVCRIEQLRVVPRLDALARYCRACRLQLDVRPL